MLLHFSFVVCFTSIHTKEYLYKNAKKLLNPKVSQKYVKSAFLNSNKSIISTNPQESCSNKDSNNISNRYSIN